MKQQDLELLKMTLSRRDDLTPKQVADIIADMRAEIESAADADEDKPPAVKKQWVILVSDPEKTLRALGEFTGWVVQIPEDESVYTAVERLHRAGYEYNTTKKGRRMPVRSLGEVIEHTPAKIAKEQAVWIKHKEPVFVLPTDWELPREAPEVASAKARQIVIDGFNASPTAKRYEARIEVGGAHNNESSVTPHEARKETK